MAADIPTNLLYFGDNLTWLREHGKFPDESVDLVYLYLHCDPTASHYLKLLLDAVFGPRNFRGEIVWKRTSAHNSGNKFGPVHDCILFYAASHRTTWNVQYRPLDESYEVSHYRNVENGRRYKRQDLTGAGVGGASIQH